MMFPPSSSMRMSQRIAQALTPARIQSASVSSARLSLIPRSMIRSTSTTNGEDRESCHVPQDDR
eukprot:47676-Eustigmatos_ZCMA.PRE.1